MNNDLYNSLESQTDQLTEICILASVIKADAKYSSASDINKDLESYVESLEKVAKNARYLLEKSKNNSNLNSKNNNVIPLRKG